MRSYMFYKPKVYIIGFILCFFIGCSEEEEIVPEKNSPYITDGNGSVKTTLLEFVYSGKTNLFLKLEKTSQAGVSASLNFDAAVLENYNKVNNTAYKIFPKELVTFNENTEIAPGKLKSDKVEIRFLKDASVEREKTYAIPIKAILNSSDVLLSGTETEFIVFVKDKSLKDNCFKDNGLKIISCMEVNGTNPLNNLCFTLKKSGKYFIDVVILFSSNINFDEKKNQVYVYHNENVQHILDNRDTYIKPLQERGMKVLLSILGNHDKAGVANLGDETARDFAKKLKAECDTYGLDGVFFDDEYSKYEYPTPPGFVIPSNMAASRLLYETKKIMPDKLVCPYVYSRTSKLYEVDKVQPGNYVDYGIHDYRRGTDMSSNYPGMPNSNMILYSQEFTMSRFVDKDKMQEIVDGGYGGTMIFAMDPVRTSGTSLKSQVWAMNNISDVLFDDEVVYNEQPYAKDW